MAGDSDNSNWKITEDVRATEDPLLSCLLMLCQYFHSPTSSASLTERLPLVNNMLTPELFIRAAKRAGLSAEITPIEFEEIDSLTLPAILLLKNGGACLLLEKNLESSTVLLHPSSKDPISIANHVLENEYDGQTIFVKLEYQATERSRETINPNARIWFWTIILKSWPIYLEVLVASLFINIFVLAVPLFTMNVYDRVVPNQAVDTMWILASGIAIVFVFDLFLKSLRSYFIDVASKKADIQLSSIIFEQILGVQMNSRPTSVGAFANTIQSFESFRDFITSTTITVLVDLPFVVIYLIVISYLGGPLVYVPLTVIPFVFLLGFLLQYPLIKMTKESYQLASEKQATLIESLSGIEAIKSSCAEGTMQHRFEQVVHLSATLSAKLRLLINSSMSIMNLAQQISSVLLIVFGVYRITEGDLTVGALIACTILAGRALAPMGQVAAIFTRYYQSMQALESIDKIMQLPTDVAANTHYLHRANIDGNIDFKSVDYHFPESPLPILTNLSFSIKKGERVAIIGRIGSGKSTIAKLIMGLYRPSKGSIYIDKTDYLQLNPADIRRQIGYVPQDVVLFYGSIKDNIRLGAPYVSDLTLLDAANLSGVNQFTQIHPEGFDKQVGERGSRLSAGQRQAVAIARALILSPNVLLFDEPTASMDDASEAQLRKTLKTQIEAKNNTFILITHKASMLDLVDRIIVLDSGRVVADGPKESVLKALQGGIKIK